MVVTKALAYESEAEPFIAVFEGETNVGVGEALVATWGFTAGWERRRGPLLAHG